MYIDDVEVNSIGDLAVVLNDKYSEALNQKSTLKKGESSAIFLGIINDLFAKCGSFFRYDNLSKFKSDIILCKNTIKNSKHMFARRSYEKHFEKYTQEIEPKIETAYPSSICGEGAGESFTMRQVQQLGLNPESY